MTDRELLVLAAKAAGLNELTEWADQITDYDSPHYMQWALYVKEAGGQCKSWNPLIDDGDALRLAVKLGTHICFYGATVVCATMGGEFLSDEVDTTGDRTVATRRAIVRAAAEMGRAKP